MTAWWESRPHVGFEIRPHSLLTVVGEAPGGTEEKLGRPFVGQSGRVLEDGLKAAGISRTDISIANALPCRPAHDQHLTPKQWKEALDHFRPQLEAILVPGSIVLALGAKALQTLTGKARITPWVGSPLEGLNRTFVLPSFHPAAALRKPALLPVVKMMIIRAVKLARKEIPDWTWPELIT